MIRVRSGAVRALVALVVVAGLLVLALRNIDPAELAAALGRADWRLLAIAALFNLTVNVASRTLRWWSLLRVVPGVRGRPPRLSLARLVLAGAAAANLLPGRGGEVIRTVGAHRLLGIAVGESAAVLVVEALVEIASFALVALPLACGLGPALPLSARAALAGLVVGMVLVLGLLRWVVRTRPPAAETEAEERTGAEARSRRRSWMRWLRRQWAAGGRVWPVLLAPGAFAPSLLCSTWNAVNDALMLGLCMGAVGVSLPVGAWFVVLLALNVAIAVPATPGQLGVMELGAVLAMKSLGVRGDDALAVALLYHACHFVPLSSVGLIEVVRIGARGFRRSVAST